MFESILAWVFLMSGLVHGDVRYYIASAVFAVAAQISRIVDAVKAGNLRIGKEVAHA